MPVQSKNPMDIVSDPQNYVSVAQEFLQTEEDITAENTPKKEPIKALSRRNFLKFGGIAAAAASVASAGVTGFATGRSADAYTGYGRTYQGEDMFFNRDPFRTEVAAMMEPVGEVTRPDWSDQILDVWTIILGLIAKKQWNPTMGMEALPQDVRAYYTKHPERYTSMVDRLHAHISRLEYWHNTAYKQFAIADAYNKTFGIGMVGAGGMRFPEDPDDVYRQTGVPQPPETWDFRRVASKKMTFKSPAHATKLIKRMAHLFGASIVGICKFDERFMFKNLMRGMPDRGKKWGDTVPKHWKSIIVFGSPMYWDSVYAAIGYSTSADAYFRSRNTAGLLEAFIQNLGYPARAQCPFNSYEIMISPYTLLSGLAEYSRAGLVMVPELGSNFRPAAVITDIEFEYDKPINIGMAKFCKKCKICADTCPSGAITHDDAPTTVVRGFKRWLLDEEKCHRQWVAGSTSDGNGCRVCIAVCPYTRKNTWIHTISRELEPRDPVGVVATGLLAMQQNFFTYPAGEEFREPWDGGRDATYHDPAWWARSEDFFSNIDKEWEYNGMH